MSPTVDHAPDDGEARTEAETCGFPTYGPRSLCRDQARNRWVRDVLVGDWRRVGQAHGRSSLT